MKFSNINMDIFICPRCGKITLNNGTCTYCNNELLSVGISLFDLASENIGKSVCKIQDLYKKKDGFYKTVWNKRKNLDKQKISYYESLVWKKSLQKPIKLCPRCGYLTFNNYFIENTECKYCHTRYVDTKILARDYYNPMSGSGYIQGKIDKEIKSLCFNSAFYNEDLFKARQNSEPKDDKMFVLQREESSPPYYGVLLSTMQIPFKTNDAKNRLSLIIQYYLPIMQSKMQYILSEKAPAIENTYDLLSTINHVQNILRGQQFLGQSDSVIYCNLFLIDIIEAFTVNCIEPSQSKIRFCRKCGSKLIDDCVFCGRCGTKVI